MDFKSDAKSNQLFLKGTVDKLKNLFNIIAYKIDLLICLDYQIFIADPKVPLIYNNVINFISFRNLSQMFRNS